jgi:hypothetical protein
LGRTSTGWIAPACGWRTYSITLSARASSMGGTVNFERLRGLGIDGQLEFGWLHDRQVGGLGALKDFAGAMAISNRRNRARRSL